MKPDLTTVLEPALPESAIKRIEELLEKAKAGELSQVAFAVTYRNGSTGDSWSELCNVAQLLGAIHLLAHRLAGSIER